MAHSCIFPLLFHTNHVSYDHRVYCVPCHSHVNRAIQYGTAAHGRHGNFTAFTCACSQILEAKLMSTPPWLVPKCLLIPDPGKRGQWKLIYMLFGVIYPFSAGFVIGVRGGI